MSEQSENMEAVNRYMRTTPIVNNAAFPIKDDFIRWWDNLSWWSINMDGSAWDEARTRRNKFQLANVKNEQQRANVVRVITTGIESEEMEGKPRPTTLSTGEVGTQVKKPSTTLTARVSPGTKPVLGLNSRGPDVVQWQGIVGVKPQTGFFGQMTVDYTKKWQAAHNLPATGSVDAQSWAVALGTGGETFAPSSAPEPTFTSPPVATFKPTATAQKPVATSQVSTVPKTQTLSASTMFDFTKWPTWAQAAALTTAVISGGYAFFGKGR